MADKGDQESSEESCLAENCDYFLNFLKQLKRRDKDGMSRESEDLIRKFKTSLMDFVHTDAQTDQEQRIITEDPTVVRSKKMQVVDKEGDEFLEFINGLGIVGNNKEKVGEGAYKKQSTPVEDSYVPIKYPQKKVSVFKQKAIDKDEESSASSSDESLLSTSTKTGSRRSELLNRESLLRHLDNRKVPDLEKFDEASGKDLNNYLSKFETYCSANYRGSEEFWPTELEKHLTGNILENFKWMREVKDDYDYLKDKLQ